MPVQGMAWNWIGGFGGDHGGSASIQVNFAPTEAVAECSLSSAIGDGLCACGITQYVTRHTPSGEDHFHHPAFDTDTFWLTPIAHDKLMTSVTARLDLGGGGGQQGTVSLMVSLF